MNWAEHAVSNDREYETVVPAGWMAVPIVRYTTRFTGRGPAAYEVVDILTGKVADRFDNEWRCQVKASLRNSSWRSRLGLPKLGKS